MRIVSTLLTGVALLVAGLESAAAQPYNAEHHLDMRITGMILPADTPKQEDVPTVDISIQEKPMVLRLGKVEDLSTREKSQAAKNDVLLRLVRFTGSDDLMKRLLQPGSAGKVLTIEGWLNAQDRIFQVTAVNEASGATPATKGH